MAATTDADLVLVVDFGAQYAQLIARRVREAHVYSEIVPRSMPIAEMLARNPEFVELDPPRRLVHTFGWEPEGGKENPVPPGSSTIEIELEPSGNVTLLKFRHYGLPDADAVRQHGFGWDHYLARLVIAGAGGDPGEDRVPEMH